MLDACISQNVHKGNLGPATKYECRLKYSTGVSAAVVLPERRLKLWLVDRGCSFEGGKVGPRGKNLSRTMYGHKHWEEFVSRTQMVEGSARFNILSLCSFPVLRVLTYI